MSSFHSDKMLSLGSQTRDVNMEYIVVAIEVLI